jgi:hypothetical protein
LVILEYKLCSSCQASKQVGNTHRKKSMMSTSKAFELLHMDLFVPTQYTSIGGNKYSNRLYCHPSKEKTPYELLNGRKPNIIYFWVFGCKCYILNKGTRLSKFDKKCDEGFLLGYSTTSKAYRV